MWLSFLGPLLVEVGGAQRTVPAAKQRAVLAMLAVNANNVVPAGSLAEAMWGPRLPPSSQHTTRTYVHRLRKCLDPDGHERIVTQSPGYMLQVRPGELDLLRFESLAREGRARLNASDWAGASSRLAEAEALWRGTALADIPSRYAHDRYIRYLEQTRLTATESRIEADVRTSRHASAGVIPELEGLTSRYPERERLWQLLMLALYRAGRQTQALKMFADVRIFSVDEHGVDPGPDLAHMHKRVLAQDPSLLAEELNRSSFALALPCGPPESARPLLLQAPR